MNNTIDFNTAKTIGTMSKKIDHIDDTVSGFFSFMHMVMQNELGNAEPYFAAVSPVLDLTVIRPDDAPHILPCFDEADEGIGISEDEPLGFRYNPKQVIKLMGKRYLVGPVIFHRFDDERNFASLTMSDMYTMPNLRRSLPGTSTSRTTIWARAAQSRSMPGILQLSAPCFSWNRNTVEPPPRNRKCFRSMWAGVVCRMPLTRIRATGQKSTRN